MSTVQEQCQTLRITLSETIAAPAEVVWESLLYKMGPGADFDPKSPMHLKLEAFPGGRWYRDLGEGVGHLWGHVQVIKPGKLLEINGPMFMSYAAAGHVQYRLVPDGEKTRLELTHTAIGLIPPDVKTNVTGGWGQILKSISAHAQQAVAV